MSPATNTPHCGSTVAKAEHALAVAGLVEVVPQWGVFVAGDTPDSPG